MPRIEPIHYLIFVLLMSATIANTARSAEPVFGIDGRIIAASYFSGFKSQDGSYSVRDVSLVPEINAFVGIDFGPIEVRAHGVYNHFEDELDRAATSAEPFIWGEVAHESGLTFTLGDVLGRKMPVSRGIANNPTLTDWSVDIERIGGVSQIQASPYGSTRSHYTILNMSGLWFNGAHSSDKKIGLSFDYANSYIGVIHDIGRIVDINGIEGDGEYTRIEAGTQLALGPGTLHLGAEYVDAGSYIFTNGLIFNPATGKPRIIDHFVSTGLNLVYETEKFDIGLVGRIGSGGDLTAQKTNDDATYFGGVSGSYKLDEAWEIAGSYKYRRSEYELLNGNWVYQEIQAGLSYQIDKNWQLGVGARVTKQQWLSAPIDGFKAIAGLQYTF